LETVYGGSAILLFSAPGKATLQLRSTLNVAYLAAQLQALPNLRTCFTAATFAGTLEQFITRALTDPSTDLDAKDLASTFNDLRVTLG
jgi:hypothetical protein